MFVHSALNDAVAAVVGAGAINSGRIFVLGGKTAFLFFG
jgi:hypothetical protein